MALFNKKKKYVDLSQKMRNKQESLNEAKSEIPPESKNESQGSSGSGFFSFFGGGGNANSVSSADPSNETPEEKRRKLSKKLYDMTAKAEDLENQIYNLKQRVEVLERKQKVGY
ncbi:MAG: hypothetical protein Q8Q04_01460 [archaeon]|nr:hypothetical protein [archaeon]